jgi:adenylyltransferase/sulfurtransferase
MQLSAKEQQRYSRHLMLEGFGEKAQLKLKQSKVLVIGAGGLGCPALLYLAAAGVGLIGIADNDSVSISNLQRQVLYTIEDLGKNKALAASKHLSLLNSEIEIISIPERVDAFNVLSLIEGYDVIIDGSDNFSTRYLLNDACVIKNKPLVYGAIFKYEGQVSSLNLDDGPTYRCLFPFPPDSSAISSCNEVGVLGVLPGIVGTWQAAEAIKIITGVGQPLKGVLMSFDLLNNHVNYFRFKLNADNKLISELGSYDFKCEQSKDEVDVDAFRQWLSNPDVQLVDVRELHEYSVFNLGGKHIPIASLEVRMNEIDCTKLTIIYCQSGKRSIKGLEMIKAHNPDIKIFSLKNGLNNFRRGTGE